MVDMRVPYSDEFYASVKVASEYIKKHIYEDMTGYDDVIASCVGHTHIDVAWLWTVDQVRQKSCRSFATVLKLMEEFPDYHVEERSAVSIARRLQDPLSELVKIDSKSIGVGQYQHDVNQKKLNESLDFVVSKAVNSVGVNINTASPSILKYVSGLTKTTIDKLVKYREENGKILSRSEILKKKLLSAKVYEQAIGFMRVIDGDNILDITPIHPESYDATLELLSSLGLTVKDIGSNELINKLDNLDMAKYCEEKKIDKYTLEDIVKCLKQPNRDFRDDFPKPLLKSDILKLEDLSVGMQLQGTVRNVVDFGAFIDIGIKNDGLVHISELSDKFVKNPSEIVSVGDIVKVKVIKIDTERKKVGLSMKL